MNRELHAQIQPSAAKWTGQQRNGILQGSHLISTQPRNQAATMGVCDKDIAEQQRKLSMEISLVSDCRQSLKTESVQFWGILY